MPFAARVRLGACAATASMLMVLPLSACNREAHTDGLFRFTGQTMGTSYTVKMGDLPEGGDRSKIHAGIDQILERINSRMSTYREDSELTLFNRNKTTDWVEVSSETVFVVHEALRISRLTDGAFDITVGPLVNLWGFGPGSPSESLPDDNAIQTALESVGYEHLHVQDSPPALRKDRPDVQIDLSAIAKGYAVDQLAEYLESIKIGNYLVEVGGELRGKGEKAQGKPWKVAVEKPVPHERTILHVLHLGSQAMATSGDYRNFFVQNAQRFSHTINPRTGQPVTHQLASVTVVTPSCMEADALATGLMVLGPKAGHELAIREKLPALFITRIGEGFQERATPDLDRFLNVTDS